MTRYLPLDKVVKTLQAKTDIAALIPWWIFAYEPLVAPNEIYLILDIVTQTIPDSYIRENRVQFTLVGKDKNTKAKALQNIMEKITECLIAVNGCCEKGITDFQGFKVISVYETNTYRPSFTWKGIRCLLVDYIFKYWTFTNV